MSAVAVEDRDDLGGAAVGGCGLGGHGVELGGFAGGDADVALAEVEDDVAGEDEEPVAAGADALLDRAAVGWSPVSMPTWMSAWWAAAMARPDLLNRATTARTGPWSSTPFLTGPGFG